MRIQEERNEGAGTRIGSIEVDPRRYRLPRVNVQSYQITKVRSKAEGCMACIRGMGEQTTGKGESNRKSVAQCLRD